MTRLRHPLLLALSLPLALMACKPSTDAATAPASQTANPASEPAAADSAFVLQPQRKDVSKGLYEIAFDPASSSLFAASTGFDAKDGGRIYQLDATTLDIKHEYPVERRSFALGLNRNTNTLYIGNTLDGSVTALDAGTGTTKGVFQLGKTDAEGNAAHTRKVIVDEAGNRLFVTNPEETEGRLWIVDGASGKILHTLEKLGKYPTGAAYDSQNKRLYVGHGGTQEIAVVDPDSGKVVNRFDTGEADAHYFINLAVDPASNRLFASDASTSSLVVFDTTTGKVIKTVPAGVGTLDILFNPVRQEIYLTDRGVNRETKDGSGHLSVIDATSYAVKHTLDLPPHPNSLALSDDGQTLYVSVKNGRGADTPEGIVRIPLQ